MKARFIKRQDVEDVRCIRQSLKDIKGFHDIYMWRVTGKRGYFGCSLSAAWLAPEECDCCGRRVSHTTLRWASGIETYACDDCCR
jgi:hypothetical protein